MTDNLEFEYDHIRAVDDEHRIFPRGGATMCYVKDKEGNILATGLAVCHPNDNFNKKLGRLISKGRALKKLEESV